MKSFVVQSVFAAALVIAPLARSAAPLDSSGVFPAPVSLMNFSPAFAGHPGDLSLLAPRGFHALPALGMLTLKHSEGSTSRPRITDKNAANFRFEARVDSPAALATPATGTLFFKKDADRPPQKSN